MARARDASRVVFGAAAGVLALELVVRLASGHPFYFGNELERRVLLAENNCAADWDPELGWAPTVDKSGRENLWGTKVTILPGGIRDNGAPPPRTAPILALGDSYVFGDEVSDEDAWPAKLERLTGRRVVNAGVCAYGVDQSFLRLEKLAPELKPKAVVFGLIDLALNRAQVAAYPTAVGDRLKPYFRRGKTGWELAGAPVPRFESSISLSPSQRLGGYSRLVDAVMSRLAPARWRVGTPDEEPALTGEDGVSISCALLASLPKAARGAQVIALLQHHVWENDDGRRRMEAARACAEGAGLKVVELKDLPRSLYLPGGHLSADGNQRVAEAVAAALK